MRFFHTFDENIHLPNIVLTLDRHIFDNRELEGTIPSNIGDLYNLVSLYDLRLSSEASMMININIAVIIIIIIIIIIILIPFC